MAAGRAWPNAILLADGRVLAVGTGGYGLGSATAEAWDPATLTWTAVQDLNKPRTAFAAVPLADGRALVAGGLNQGTVDTGPGADPAYSCEGSDPQSFSSTYVLDPRSGAWTKSDLLGSARTSPVAVRLLDGRVLVAGGYFYQKPSYGSRSVPGMVAAIAVPAEASAITAAFAPRTDVEVPPHGYALATAELFDPATGTWSPTGPMKYARAGAQAVTLADGRVLVVSALGDVVMDGRAGTTAEIYDPHTGRFALTGSLPPIDRAALAGLGITVPEGDPELFATGQLVALEDGGALLVGNWGSWKHQADVTRSFRYDAQSGRWTEVGQTAIAVFNPVTAASGGPLRWDPLVARLGDGRVLVAGGNSGYPDGVARSAELYDPATNAWTTLPPMPEPRAGGSAVSLADGSVLLVGGYGQDASFQCDEPYGLDTAIRFVPAPANH